MDLSVLKYDQKAKTIVIDGITPRQTVEAIKELIDTQQIDPYGFQSAYLTYKPVDGACIELTRSYSAAPYQTIYIKTINLKNTEPEIGEFTDVECTVEILKLLSLYMFDSIEDILKDPSNYVQARGGKYTILSDKSGLFRYETPHGGATFIYD